MYAKKTTLLFVTICTSLFVHAQTKVDKKALQELADACKRTHSTALSVWVDGKPYKDYSFDSTGNDRALTYSAQKSIISLAIGKLIDEGKPIELDSPVYRYYPEWKQGLKKTVTIRQLLNHTSAIECNEADPDGWDPKDVVQYALCASIIDTPGHYFLYNDHAVDLLRGVIERVSGEKMDAYIKHSFFDPMDIKDFSWTYDAAGTPTNLSITTAELVKFGQLMINKGTWNGKQLISEHWVDLSLKQSQPFAPNYGLLWWRIPDKIIYTVDEDLLHQFKAAGVSDDFITKYSSLKGTYENVNIPDKKLKEVFGDNWKEILDKELYAYYPRRAKWGFSDNYTGYKAEGWRGQYVVFYPEKHIVACRMARESPSYNDQTDEFRDFEQYVNRLVK